MDSDEHHIQHHHTQLPAPHHQSSRRTSQRLAKQPSIEELEPLHLEGVPTIAARSDELEQVSDLHEDVKIVRACAGGSLRNKSAGDLLETDEHPIVSRQRYASGTSKARSNTTSHRSKAPYNHQVNKNHNINNNNHAKEEDLEKRYEEKKFEDLQRKLSDSIRSRDETAAAISALPSDLRPVIEPNGGMELLDQQHHHHLHQQRIHSNIDYRLVEQQCTAASTNGAIIIAQSDNNSKLACEFNNHSEESFLHDSKTRVKLKPDDLDDEEMHVLSNGLDPMDSYMPLVGELSEPLLDEDPPKKVFLSDSSDSMDTVLCNSQEMEDKRRKRDDKKDDKNKKKKLKPLEEENLSK